jgi:uncharacterized protein (TIGR03437 family)
MLEIRTVAPQVFAIGGLPAAVLVRVRDGVQAVEPILETDATGIVPVPIDIGPDTDQLFLLLFGTGLRFGATVTVTIGGVYVPVEYFGSQHEYAGMDQVNLRLPRSLAGRGLADVKLMVDGEIANVTQLVFRNRL